MRSGYCFFSIFCQLSRSDTVRLNTGLPGFESYNWQGIIVPAGTPRPIVDKLNEAFNRVLKKPEVIKAFDATGGQAVGGTPEAFADFIKSETTKWAELIKSANISVN